MSIYIKRNYSVSDLIFDIFIYENILSNNDIYYATLTSVARTVLGTLTSLSATTLLAYILSRREYIFRKSLTKFLVITMYFNAGVIPVYMLYKYLGLINKFSVYIIPTIWFDTYLYASSNQSLSTLQYELMKRLQSAVQSLSGTNAPDYSGAQVNNIQTVTPQSIRATMTVIAAVPILFAYPFLQRYFVSGLTLGGVKG